MLQISKHIILSYVATSIKISHYISFIIVWHSIYKMKSIMKMILYNDQSAFVSLLCRLQMFSKDVINT